MKKLLHITAAWQTRGGRGGRNFLDLNKYLYTDAVYITFNILQHSTTGQYQSRSIAANVVIGTNIFSDIGAGYANSFRSRTNSHEARM